MKTVYRVFVYGCLYKEFADKADAEAEAIRLKAKGYRVWIEEVDLD